MENTGFMKVFITIVLVQAFIVNAGLIPIPAFGVDQQYVQLRPLLFDGMVRCGGVCCDHDPCGYAQKGDHRKAVVSKARGYARRWTGYPLFHRKGEAYEKAGL